MSQHTRGPWEIMSISRETGNISVGQREFRIVIADVTNAASFGDLLAGAMKRRGGSFDPSDAKTQFANARLIAASPDLLEASLAAARAIGDWSRPTGANGMVAARADHPLVTAMRGLYAAISKANPPESPNDR